MAEKDFFDLGIFSHDNIEKARQILESITKEDIEKVVKLFKMIEVHDDRIVINLKPQFDIPTNS